MLHAATIVKSNTKKVAMGVMLVLSLLANGCAQQDGVRSQATRAAETQSNFPGALYRGNAARTGEYPAGAAPVLSEQFWTFVADPYDSIQSPPIFAEGLIFFVTMNRGLHAVDAEAGQVRWIIEDAEDAIFPTVVDGVIFYGSKEGLHAMEVKTRQEKWTFKTGEQDVSNSPLVYAGVIYFGTEAGTFYAVNADTGQLIWEVKLDDMISSTPSIDDGVVYVVSSEDKTISDLVEYQDTLHALDMQSGKSLWKFSPDGSEDTPGAIDDPIIYDGAIYAATGYNAYTGPGYLYSFDAKNGAELWKYTPTDGNFSNPRALAADNGLVYITASNDLGGRLREGITYALDAATGKERWHIKAGIFGTTEMIAGDTIFVGSGNEDESTTYSALDASSGTKLREITVDLTALMPPLIAQGRMYIAGSTFDPPQSKLIAVR
jgi:outer membrane protein assembly factor BamB